MISNEIFLSLLFSIIGIAFYYFGKRNNIYFQIAGGVLMIFPYFISTLLWLIIFGCIAIVVPFILTWLNPA